MNAYLNHTSRQAKRKSSIHQGSRLSFFILFSLKIQNSRNKVELDYKTTVYFIIYIRFSGAER